MLVAEDLVHRLGPTVMTGRIWWRYTVSVTFDELWPMRRLISSIAIPLSGSRETYVYRSSRGVHSSPMPALLQIVRSDRRTSAASSSHSDLDGDRHSG
jgi:hypothetical protein